MPQSWHSSNNARIRIAIAAFVVLSFLAICITGVGWLSGQSLPYSPSLGRGHSYEGNDTHLWPPAVPFFELEGIVVGKPFEKYDDLLAAEDILAKLGTDLTRRFAARNLSIDSTPQCSLDVARYETSGILKSSDRHKASERITVALNLYNSEEILLALSLALLELVSTLHPSHEIYISIFENGSTDQTRVLLGDLASALLFLGVEGVVFRSSTLVRTDGLERIISLANLRNEALLPLLPIAADGVLLFVNDVITCGADLLELIHQLRLQKAHVSISTDWQVWGHEEVQLRDLWVARGINGDLVYPMKKKDGFSMYAPHGSWLKDLFVTQDEVIHKRYLDGRPIPMYSGWNGAVAFQAKLFTDYHIRFRASGQGTWRGGDILGKLGKWGQLVGTPGYLESDCAASECKLLARDIWNLLGGKARFVLASQSRTVYQPHHWPPVSKQCPPVQRKGADDFGEELIDWTNVTIPQEVVCVSILNATGQDTDPWGEGNMRTKLDPYFPGFSS